MYDLPRNWRTARALNTKHYYTGKPCKFGHTTTRNTDTGMCSECAKAVTGKQTQPTAYYQQWRDQNRERYREYQRVYQRTYKRKRKQEELPLNG